MIQTKINTEMNKRISIYYIFLIITPTSGRINFERADPIVWVEQEDRVRTGDGLLEIHHKRASPSILNARADDHTIEKLEDLMRNNLVSDCENKYDGELRELYGKILKCLPRTIHPNALKRDKRFFDPITLGAIGIGVVVGCAQIGEAIYSYFSPNSSSNRLDRMEIENAERDKKLKSIDVDLHKAKSIRSDLIELERLLINNITMMDQKIDYLASSIPRIAMTAADMVQVIDKEKTTITNILRQCSKSRASPEDYAKLFRAEMLRDLKPQDTLLTDVRKDNDTMVFELYYSRFSMDTKIYKAFPTRQWQNVTTEPVLIRYSGPIFAMHNLTSNCTLGIEDPAKRFPSSVAQVEITLIIALIGGSQWRKSIAIIKS